MNQSENIVADIARDENSKSPTQHTRDITSRAPDSSNIQNDRLVWLDNNINEFNIDRYIDAINTLW
jgi:hypothetical protein